MQRSTRWTILAGIAAIMLLPANATPNPDRALRLATADAGIPAAAADAAPIAAYDPARRALPRFRPGRASAYGPGLYGNGTACGQTLTRSTRGVAHRSLPCGAVLDICHRGRCARAKVIDRGPFISGRTHDLTEQTVNDLGVYASGNVSAARRWGVRDIRWRCVRRCR